MALSYGYEVYEKGFQIISTWNGAVVGSPRPIGEEIAPFGGARTSAYVLRIVVDPHTNSLITMYPISDTAPYAPYNNQEEMNAGLNDVFGNLINSFFWAR